MPAPKGNQFWKARTKHGRDRIFASAEILWQACCEYFDWIDEHPLYEEKVFCQKGKIIRTEVAKKRIMTLNGLSIFLDIGLETWRGWRTNKDFSGVVTAVEKIIYNQKLEGAAAEMFNPNIIARELGLTDKQEIMNKTPTVIKDDIPDDDES